MKLEDQVISLELAKRLKELGVKQDSLFCYTKDNKYDLEFLPTEIRNENVCIAAFTSAELGELLPTWSESCKHDDKDWHITVIEKNKKIPHHSFMQKKTNITYHSFDETEANARAKILIYLVEYGLT